MFKNISSDYSIMLQFEDNMRYTAQHKQDTHERIVTSARRLFNRRGFSDVSIEEIMQHAGLTRGGFYRHFDSKEQLYSHAVRQFLCMRAPERWQKKHVDSRATGSELARMIVDAYLSREHLDDRDGSCPLVALPSDVARDGTAVKGAFREVLGKMVQVFAANLAHREARQQALSLVAMCVGAMVIARAIDDAKLADEIRAAARGHVLGTAGWNKPELVDQEKIRRRRG
jgi:AcrR family transcriptional regulator